MKRILAMRSFIGVIAVALVFSFTMLSTNSSVYAASSTAEVTHVEVSANGKVIKELKKETFAYPIGEEFDKHMSQFDGYMLSGISSSSKSIDGAEKVVAKVEWQKIENKEEQKNEKIPYETKEKEDPALNKGEKVVEQEGVAGEKTVTYKVTYVGGIERSREVISEEVTVDPVEEITRVGTKVTEVKEEQKTEEIPYETKEKEDPTLDKGEKVVKQEGVAGEKTITYNVTYVNGEEVDREIASEEITVEPVDEIILIGTKVTEVKEEQKTEEIPYETKEKEDPTLDYGEKVVEQAGVAGEKTITYKVTYVNGEEVDREIASEEVTVEPVDGIIRVGTKGMEVKEEEETEEIPYETIQKEDPELDKGEKVIDQKGVTGEKVTTYKVTYVNGEEVSREAITEEITVEPKEEIIRVGTKTNGSNDGSENDGDKSEGDDTSGSNDSNETDDDNTTGTKNDDGLSGVKESETDNNGNSDNATGERLPNTATNIFNIGLIGIALLFSGILITLFRRFKGSKA
ncbi:G5 domain-containing protein [Virgibacillus pantothenticus]|uniref:G5 domain-containing protein n=1 Tax=Virgibacillus pantothenticus TaxID=1473 RepID=UPI003D2A6182